MTRTARWWRTVVLGLLASAASIEVCPACRPATFDDLTSGGPKGEPKAQDQTAPEAGTDAGPPPPPDSITPPRPISPISVSWVATLRPHFVWSNATGFKDVVLELSRTRDFPPASTKTYRPSGTDFTPDEDLERGFWFWRLHGRVGDEPGTFPSATWELLVRGNTAKDPSKVSKAPAGTVVDANGDGEPDLTFTTTGLTDPSDPTSGGSAVYLLLAGPDHSFDVTGHSWSNRIEHEAAGIGGGTDVDGDGFTDIAIGDYFQDPSGGPVFEDVWLMFGGTSGFDQTKTQSIDNFVPLPTFSSLPLVEMGGDMNGDGFGDFALSLPDYGFTVFGGAIGDLTFQLFNTAEPPAPPTPPAMTGGCDLDGDGFSDLAFASSLPGSPVTYSHGGVGRFGDPATIQLGNVSPPPSANAVASGDFDGNGVNDLAFSTLVNGAPGVCVVTPQGGSLNASDCWTTTGPIAGFGTSLGAADLDADGTDDILVGSSSGIVALKRDASGFTATPIPGQFQPSVAVIHPGRPDPARWAALSEDGKQISVFKGTVINQVVLLSADRTIVKAGPRIR